MITQDYLDFAEICNDNYRVMADLIVWDMKSHNEKVKFSKVLDDLECEEMGTGRLDKYALPIKRILDKPMKVIRGQINTLFSDEVISEMDMMHEITIRGYFMLHLKIEATLLYIVVLFKGDSIKSFSTALSGEDTYEAMQAAYNYVMER